MTVAEPVRDEPDTDLVPCPYCDPPGVIVTEHRGHVRRRRCRDCKGTPGLVLREWIVVDACVGAWPCCQETTA